MVWVLREPAVCSTRPKSFFEEPTRGWGGGGKAELRLLAVAMGRHRTSTWTCDLVLLIPRQNTHSPTHLFLLKGAKRCIVAR